METAKKEPLANILKSYIEKAESAVVLVDLPDFLKILGQFKQVPFALPTLQYNCNIVLNSQEFAEDVGGLWMATLSGHFMVLVNRSAATLVSQTDNKQPYDVILRDWSQYSKPQVFSA